jgi:hypothetical protein
MRGPHEQVLVVGRVDGERAADRQRGRASVDEAAKGLLDHRAGDAGARVDEGVQGRELPTGREGDVADARAFPRRP